MVDYIKRSRSDSTKPLLILLFICVILIFVIIFLFLILPNLFMGLQKDILHAAIPIGIVPVVTYAIFLSKFIVYVDEMKSTAFSVFIKSITDFWEDQKILLGVSLLCCISFISLCKLWEEHAFPLETIVLFIVIYPAVGIFLTLIFRFSNYDDAELSSSQTCEKSIGALWAIGAYKSYYRIALKDIINRIKAFEKEKDIVIAVKKLFVICPLSCNIEGSLKDRDEHIYYIGELEPLVCDQGGNTNRVYKQSVYRIENADERYIHVVAEFASPLGTLWKKRRSMHKEKVIYQRDCLVKTLKELLQNRTNVVILEYDDRDPLSTKSLSRFLLSSVDKLLQDRNINM